MSLDKLETVEDLRKLGIDAALSFRNSDRVRSAAREFYMLQDEAPSRVGPIACETKNIKKRIAAVQILGELRTKKVLPYLEQAIRAEFSENNVWSDKIWLQSTMVTSLFRTESYGGHKIIRKLWNAEEAKDIQGMIESYQGFKSNLSWLFWSKAICNYQHSERCSKEGLYLSENKHYKSAEKMLGSAIAVYPYFSGHWMQYAENKMKMVKGCKESDLEDLKNATSLCLRITQELNPFLVGNHERIGMNMAELGNFDSARCCYNLALELNPGIINESSLFFHKAETYEKTDGTKDNIQSALYNYKISRELCKEMKKIAKNTMPELPYDLDDRIKDINQRIKRLK